jgi:hypothetical protein
VLSTLVIRKTEKKKEKKKYFAPISDPLSLLFSCSPSPSLTRRRQKTKAKEQENKAAARKAKTKQKQKTLSQVLTFSSPLSLSLFSPLSLSPPSRRPAVN